MKIIEPKLYFAVKENDKVVTLYSIGDLVFSSFYIEKTKKIYNKFVGRIKNGRIIFRKKG